MTWLRAKKRYKYAARRLQHPETGIMNIESQKRYRLFLIVLLYLVCMTIGIMTGVSGIATSDRRLLQSLILAIILVNICILDSWIVGKPLPRFSYWLVFMLFFVAVPVCIVRARGIKGVGIVFGHLIGIVLAYFVALIVMSFLFHGRMLPFLAFCF